MLKKIVPVLICLAIAISISTGCMWGQPRPYPNGVAGADSSSDTVSVGFGSDAWYFYCWLDDSASGVGYLTRFWNETAIETCSVHLRPGGLPFISLRLMDSIMFVKSTGADIFNYEACW